MMSLRPARTRLRVAAMAMMLGALLAAASPSMAQVGADLNISPKRVVFGQGQRAAVVYVFNQGDAPATYSVELVDRVMLPDGQIVAAVDHPDAAVASAARLIQYTPRRVTLQPKESQAIRVRAMPAPDGEGTEWRTHLTVTALPSETSGLTAEALSRGEEGALSLQVTALFSVSIPVIVRSAEADARAALDQIRFLSPEGEAKAALALDLVRLGANSVYGDVEVRNGDRVVGVLRGVAVYPEVERRSVTVPLTEDVRPGDILSITYRDDDAAKGRTLASASLAAP